MHVVDGPLPDGEFLSFDSILKSFFSSSVKNLLPLRSGQHPSTVFTCSPLSFLRLFFLFCLSHFYPSPFFPFSFFAGESEACGGGGQLPQSVRPLLAENLQQKSHGH
ncbi:hypothetical protein CHARACLAT_020649 [Characodon lateralis]|uniref:Transmembrane protein n=1 Tax=Characodon lateralis TaxID=208331 RepID=A0ABU7DT43_9TELE|nr:hypothetical protein [Characodon lateralis]